MSKLGDVPCGPCHACCRYEIIPLLPEEGDKIDNYEYDVKNIPGVGDMFFLKHQKNGDCVYLGRDGCTIHGRAPVTCREFDCRGWYIKHTRKERQEWIARSPGSRAVFNAGRERLKTLDALELPKNG